MKNRDPPVKKRARVKKRAPKTSRRAPSYLDLGARGLREDADERLLVGAQSLPDPRVVQLLRLPHCQAIVHLRGRQQTGSRAKAAVTAATAAAAAASRRRKQKR